MAQSITIYSKYSLCLFQEYGSFQYWNHVWAIPCNTVEECDSGLDEDNCQLSNWILEITLASVIFLLFAILFLYLLKYGNSSIQHIEKSTESIQKSSNEKYLHIALLVEHKNYDEIRNLYNNELEIHESEANLICCWKVYTISLPFCTTINSKSL